MKYQLQLLEQPGGHVYVAHAPVWDRSSTTLQGRDHLLIGVTPKTLRAHAERGLSTYIGQLYGVVVPGLINTRFLFRGFKRGMRVGDDGEAASKKLAATWIQGRDAKLIGPRSNPELEFTDAPANRVFAVYISPNEMLTEFPLIYGWAEHWTWIASDPEKAGAPIDWGSRYDEELWAAP